LTVRFRATLPLYLKISSNSPFAASSTAWSVSS
jgi:hypothetical protein